MDRTSTNGNVKPSGVTHRYTRPGFNPRVGEHKKIMVIHDEFCAIMPHVEYLFLSRILNLADSPDAIIDSDGWLLLQSDFVRRHYHFTPRHQKTIVANLTKLGFLQSEGRNSHGGQRQRWVKVNVGALDEAIRASLEAERQPPQSRLSSDPEPINGRPRDDKRPSAERKVVQPEPINGRPRDDKRPSAERKVVQPEPINGRPRDDKRPTRDDKRPTRDDKRPTRDDKRLSRSMETDIQTDIQKKNQTEGIRTPPQRPPVVYFDPKEPYPPEQGKEDEKLSPSVGLPADLDANVSSGIFGTSFLGGGKKAAQGGDAPHQKVTSGSQRARQKIDEQMKQPPSERVARAVLDTTDTESPYTVGERNLTSEEKRFTPAEWAELAKRENIRQRDVIDIIVEWTDRRAKLNTRKREAAGREQGEKHQPPVPPKRDQSTTKESSNHQQEGSPSAWADALCAAAQRAGYGPKAYKRLAWEKEFSSLALRVGDDARVSRAVAWYCENMGGEYVPVAHTAVAFAAKFGAIEAAMRRAAGAPKPAKTSGPLPRTEDGLWLEADLADIDFPTAPDHPTYTDMLEGSLAFLNALRAALRAAAEDGTLPSDRHGYAAESLADNLHPMSLTSRWLEDIQRHYRRRKTAWGGKPGVMGLENRYLQSWVEGIFDEDGRPAWLWGEIKPHLNL